MLTRADDKDGPPSLTWGQRVVLEADKGFDDELLAAAAPRQHDLAGLATKAARLQRPTALLLQ